MYRLTCDDTDSGHTFATATQAVRGLAGAVRALPLSDAERRDFDAWYTTRTYRSAAGRIREGHRYELTVQAGGVPRTFTVAPPPPLPFQPPTPLPVTRVVATRAPDLNRPPRTPDPYVWRLPDPREARWRRWARRCRTAGRVWPFTDEESRWPRRPARPPRTTPTWDDADDVVRPYIPHAAMSRTRHGS